MPRNIGARPKLRLIHVKLTDDIHKELRIKVAELDTSIQDWVAKLVADNLKSRRK